MENGTFVDLSKDPEILAMEQKVFDMHSEYRRDKGIPDIQCCFCDRVCETYGHNPYPLKPKDTHERCCNVCNGMKVIPARMAMYVRQRHEDGTYKYGNVDK